MVYLDRLVGLASELHSISKPQQSKPDGSPPDDPPNGDNITSDEIESLTNVWLNLGFDKIEERMSQLKDHNPEPAR